MLISVPGVAGFHMGMINDLWFKVAQLSLSTLKIFSYSSGPSQQQLEIEFNRPLFNGKPGEARQCVVTKTSTVVYLDEPGGVVLLPAAITKRMLSLAAPAGLPAAKSSRYPTPGGSQQPTAAS